MKKTLNTGIAICAVTMGALWSFTATDVRAGRGDGPIVYVKSQDLFYDSIVTANPLPPHGPFQELEMDGPPPNGLQTQYGPGDSGYLGGRWWVDANGNGEMDEEDDYFSCPLLGPGRESA